jgi:hypothetical protein
MPQRGLDGLFADPQRPYERLERSPEAHVVVKTIGPVHAFKGGSGTVEFIQWQTVEGAKVKVEYR